MTDSTRTYSTVLTKGFLLHPLAGGLALVAFGLDISHNCVGVVAGFIVTILAWAFTLAVMAINFAFLGVRVLSLFCHPFFEPLPSMTHANTLL